MRSRLLPALGIVAGLVGLLLDFWVIVSGLSVVSPENPVAHSLPYSVIYYFTFLTHLTNLALVLAYASALAGWRWLNWFRTERTRAMLAGLIALVGLFYHFRLAPTLHLVGPIVYANFLLHYVSPVLYLTWWATAARHGGVRFGDIPRLLLPAFAYFLWTMLCGAVVHDYPYDVIDVDRLGYPLVIVNAAVVFLELTVLLLLVIGADGWLARRAKTGAK